MTGELKEECVDYRGRSTGLMLLWLSLLQADNTVGLHHVVCRHGDLHIYSGTRLYLGGVCDCGNPGVSFLPTLFRASF